MEQLLSKINNPYVIGGILIVYAIGWLFTKPNEAAGWKNLCSKNRVDELKKAREELKGIEKEAAFYDEAIRQELFNNLTNIRCCKEYREICQRLVVDGIASTKGIFHVLQFIHKKDSAIEIRLNLFDWTWVTFLIILLYFGAVSASFLLVDILLNINLSTLLTRLHNLSIAILFFFGALKGLVPMAAAQNIGIRLKEFEEKKKEGAAALPEQTAAACEQKQQAA